MRVFNFSAGPAVLPEPVLRKAAAEMLDWHGSGMSVMEMSHRGPEFMGIAEKAEGDLRKLLAIPASYKVLFLQGGAIAENAIIPMNLLAGQAHGRLRQHRRMVEEIDQGGEEVHERQHRGVLRGPQLQLCAGAVETWKLDPEAAYVHVYDERDDRRRRVPMDAAHRRRAARGGHVVAYPVPRHRRFALWRDLRRRAEEHRAGRPDAWSSCATTCSIARCRSRRPRSTGRSRRRPARC